MLAKLNARKIASIARTKHARPTIYRDTVLRGLAVKVMPSGHVSFVVDARIRHGRTRRIRLGTPPAMDLRKARASARQVLADMQSGRDPVALERAARQAEAEHQAIQLAASKTLGAVADDFLAARPLKPRTAAQYRYAIDTALAGWKTRPIRSITRAMVEARFAQLVRDSGRPFAQYVMRVLSAICNAAKADEVAPSERLLRDNPTDVLRDKRLRRVLKPRSRIIPLDRLGDFVLALEQAKKLGFTYRAVADLVLLLLLTGLRKQEALRLRWEDNVDYAGRFLKIVDTKNGLDHYFPLADWTRSVLADRIVFAKDKNSKRLDEATIRARLTTALQAEHEPHAVKLRGWVFPSRRTDGPLQEPGRILAAFQKATGLPFSLHDLRRTTASICQALGLDFLTIKRILNHKDRSITERYVITNLETIRQPAEQIAAFIRTKYEAAKARSASAGAKSLSG